MTTPDDSDEAARRARDGQKVRRAIIVEVTTDWPNWSSTEVERALRHAVPDLQPVVMGEVSPSVVDAAWRKTRQWARELDQHAPHDDQVHSSQKAQSFWRDAFPVAYLERYLIGEPQDERRHVHTPIKVKEGSDADPAQG